jgi:hypothetical protein
MYNQGVKGKGIYMYTNLVSLSSSQSFGHKRHDRNNVVHLSAEQFAQLDDKSLATIAYGMASRQVNDKKHRKISNALFYNLPLAGGLATLAQIGKASRVSKLLTVAGSVGSWTAALVGIDAFFGIKDKVVKSSEKLRNFESNHPIASTIATIGACFGSLALASRGLNKLANKFLPKFEAKYGEKLTKNTEKLVKTLAEKLDNSMVLNKLSELGAKVPSAIKSAGKFAAANAPLALVCASLAHSFNHKNVKNNVAVRNFEILKHEQAKTRALLEEQEFETAIM